MESDMEMVSIPKKEHEQLLESQKWLQALEAAGVDSWEGCEIARESLRSTLRG